MASAKYDLTLKGLSVRDLAMLRDALTMQRTACRAQFTSDDAESRETATWDKLTIDGLIQEFRRSVREEHPDAFSRLYEVTNVKVIDNGVTVPRVVGREQQ